MSGLAPRHHRSPTIRARSWSLTPEERDLPRSPGGGGLAGVISCRGIRGDTTGDELAGSCAPPLRQIGDDGRFRTVVGGRARGASAGRLKAFSGAICIGGTSGRFTFHCRGSGYSGGGLAVTGRNAPYLAAAGRSGLRSLRAWRRGVPAPWAFPTGRACGTSCMEPAPGQGVGGGFRSAPLSRGTDRSNTGPTAFSNVPMVAHRGCVPDAARAAVLKGCHCLRTPSGTVPTPPRCGDRRVWQPHPIARRSPQPP